MAKAMSHRSFRLLIAALALPLLSGCLAKTAFDVATMPVRAAGKAVDMATTSQAEADENRGRELRRREERLGKLEREHRKQSDACAQGDAGACRKRDAAYAEIQELLPTVPVER
jgi:hypothetical protein